MPSLSICLSVRPSVCLSLCPSVYQSTAILENDLHRGYYLASELARDARDGASGLGRQEGGAGAIPSSGSQQDAGLLRSLLALALAVLAAWLVRGTAPPFPGARGRKRVKVN